VEWSEVVGFHLLSRSHTVKFKIEHDGTMVSVLTDVSRESVISALVSSVVDQNGNGLAPILKSNAHDHIPSRSYLKGQLQRGHYALVLEAVEEMGADGMAEGGLKNFKVNSFTPSFIGVLCFISVIILCI
jgi:hypothetical protein